MPIERLNNRPFIPRTEAGTRKEPFDGGEKPNRISSASIHATTLDPSHFTTKGGRIPVSGHWRGEPYSFTLNLEPEAAQILVDHGLRLDLTTGKLIDASREFDLSPSANRYRELTNLEAPGWLIPTTNPMVFAIPAGDLRLYRSDDGTFSFSSKDDQHPGLQIFEKDIRDFASPKPSEPFTLLTDDPGIIRIERGPRLSFHAPSKKLAQLASQAFDSVSENLRVAAEERRGTEEQMLSEARELQDRLSLLYPNEALSGELVHQIQNLVGDLKEPAWGNASMTLSLFETVTKNRLLTRVEMHVVPAGEDIRSMPQFPDNLREEYSNIPFSGTLLGNTCSYLDLATGVITAIVFIKEEDFLNGGFFARHELRHLNEHVYFSDHDRRTMDEIFDQSPSFYRPYAASRLEFYPTMAQCYDGESGTDGQRWLRANHAPFVNFLEAVEQGTP